MADLTTLYQGIFDSPWNPTPKSFEGNIGQGRWYTSDPTTARSYAKGLTTGTGTPKLGGRVYSMDVPTKSLSQSTKFADRLGRMGYEHLGEFSKKPNVHLATKKMITEGKPSINLGQTIKANIGALKDKGLGFLKSPATSKFIGSNVAYGIPFAYAAMADLLQDRLEDQGLTGEGGIYDLSGGWGAMGAGADIPIIQKMLVDRRATQKGIADANMQRKIQEAEAQAQAAANAAANAAAAGQRRAGRGGSHMSRSVSQGGLGISRAQAQSVSDANRAAGMSGWGLARGGLIDLYRYGGFI